MDSDYEKKLEAGIRRELNTLGELQVPPGLEARILHAIELRMAAPWYRREWTTWPQPLQIASMIALLIVFAGLSFGAWHFVQTPGFAAVSEKVGDALGCLGLFQRTFSVLVNSLGLVFASFGPGVLAGLAVVLVFAYAACVGLGTVYVRLAFVRRQN
jgi:predicted anti-sigma-YlaC factor YlaD